MSVYPVTFHAVLRYLSRIENVALGPIAANVENSDRASQVAFEACRQLGLDFGELQRRILPEKFLPILDHATAIKLDAHVCKIEAGRVVTVLRRHDKRNRCRIPTERELRNTRRKRRRSDAGREWT